MKIFSFLTQGTEVLPIEIQVHLRFQIPNFHILGLAGPEIQEARERIIAAFASSELEFPKKKVIVNLAPSDLKKSGTGHDLAIAIAILREGKAIRNNVFAWGTLGLDGKVCSAGKIASLLELLSREQGTFSLFLSPEDAATWNELMEWRISHRLSVPLKVELNVISELKEIMEGSRKRATLPRLKGKKSTPQLLPLLGMQEKILELSIIGRHHTIILGPKGIGKSQMLEWYRWLTPIPDASKIWKRMLYLDSYQTSESFDHDRSPLRTVHSQIKPAHLLGSWGLKGFRAGELSLAHGGILVADEFLEWPRDSKECLREPLQNKKAMITRVQGSTEIACDFQLIATGNLCPCGGLPPQFRRLKTGAKCKCSPGKVQEYLKRLSGPIADRIDLVAILNDEVAPSPQQMSTYISDTELEKRREKILKCQKFAVQHFGNVPGELPVQWLESNFPKEPEFEKMITGRSISLRSRHKVMRIARTVQALEMSPVFKPEHLFQALHYRMHEE